MDALITLTAWHLLLVILSLLYLTDMFLKLGLSSVRLIF